MPTLRDHILPHRDHIYRLALAITHDPIEAQDITQDTILRAYEHRHQWPQIQNIQAWLTQTCRHIAIDHQRRHHPQSLDNPSTLPPQHHPIHNPDQDNLPEQLQHLTTLIQQLPPPQPDIIRLRHIEDLTYRDIATRLNLTQDQVRAHLRRARQHLRQQLARLNATPPPK